MDAHLGQFVAPQLHQNVDLLLRNDGERRCESVETCLDFLSCAFYESKGSTSRECLRHLEGGSTSPLARALSLIGSHRNTNNEFSTQSF